MLKYQYNKYVTTTIDFSCGFAQLPLPFFILQIRFDHSRLLLGENFKNEPLHYFRIFSNACPGNGHTFVVYSGRLSHGHTNSRRTIHRSVPSCSCCCPDTHIAQAFRKFGLLDLWRGSVPMKTDTVRR